ncbi:MAG: metallophosphoesterase family protein [Kofleriaceae bacterium]|nr:metallophosphoesterase family protein [Kofleriaceae bacterium]
MRIAAISDFHIGPTERVDCFRHTSESFHQFLDSLEATHDRIVLLGDVLQSEYGAWIGADNESAQLLAAQRRLPTLWRRFQTEPYTYLHGNHDAIAKQVSGALSELRIECDGFTVYFIHGHQFDPLLQRIYPVARLSTWFSGRVRSVGLGRVADWLEYQDVSIKHRRFEGVSGPYALAAKRLLREQEASLVVMGHTHVPQRLEIDGGIYANTGTCSHRQRMYVSIDTRRRSVKCVRDSE